MTGKSHTHWMHFVLIDDDPVSNLLARNIIKRHLPLAEFTIFTDPLAALMYLEKNTAKVNLLLDINMPVLSGWDVLEKIEALSQEIIDLLRVYIVSSSIDIDDRDRAAVHPLVLGFLEKPISPAQITEHF